MDALSMYIGALVGVVVGMVLTSLWIDRAPVKPKWWDQFERDCALTRPQATGCSHKEDRHGQ